MTNPIVASVPANIPSPRLSRDHKYVWFNGVKYEVKFRSFDGKETVVNHKETLEKIVDILKATHIENARVDLAKASLNQSGLTAENKSIAEFKGTTLEKKVDNLFLNVYSNVTFKEFLPLSKYTPKENFDPQVEFPPLANIGNSCYMDSTLELLLSVKEFIKARLKEAELEKLDAKQKKLVEALREFFNGVEKGDSCKIALAQRKIYYVLPSFAEFERRGGQQDAHAFLNLILEALNLTLPFEETKTGTVKGMKDAVEMKDTKLGKMSLLLDAPIQVRRSNLASILKLSLSVNELPHNEGNIQDINCVNRKSRTKLMLNEDGEPSDVIFVNLLRYTNQGKKITRAIDFVGKNLKFDLSELFDENTRAGRTFEYKVVGIVNHLGGYGGGHYVAKVKHENSGEWHLCDDLSQNNKPLEPGVKAFTPADKQQVYVIALKRVPPEPVSAQAAA